MNSTTLDKIGGFASALCAAHCVAMPMLLAVLPSVGLGWLAGSTFGIFAMFVTFVIAVTAIAKGFKQHRNCWPLGWLGVGVLALALGELVLEHCGLLVAHHWVSAAGGAFIAIAHWLNTKFCKTCTTCQHKS